MKKPENNGKPDKDMTQIMDTLRKEYLPKHPKAKIEAIRYYPELIWIRVISPEFAKMDITKRSGDVWKILAENFPAETLNGIGALFCLAPKEMTRSAMSLEFDDPHPL